MPASPQIIIDVAGESAGIPGTSRTFSYTKIASSSPLVTLSVANISGITSYYWELVSIPDGSTAVLNDPTLATPVFYATQAAPGTYLIRVTINLGQSIGTNGLAFRTQSKALRKLAKSENLEFGTAGWSTAINEIISAVESGGGGGGGGTLDTAYDFGGSGAGRSITVDAGSVELTVPDGADSPGLIINQNDVTNNPSTLKIANAGTGSSIELTGYSKSISGTDAVSFGAYPSTIGTDAVPSISAVVFPGYSGDGLIQVESVNLGTGDSDINLAALSSAAAATVNLTATAATTGLVSLTSSDDITFAARSSGNIPFNVAAPNNVLVGFTATSIVGALNELKSGIVESAVYTWDQEVVGGTDEVGSIATPLIEGVGYSLKIECIAGTAPAGADLELADAAFSGSHEVLYQIGLTGLGVPRYEPSLNPTWIDRNPFGFEGLTGAWYWRLTNLGVTTVTFRVTVRCHGTRS
jgi:hypothetical protein